MKMSLRIVLMASIALTASLLGGCSGAGVSPQPIDPVSQASSVSHGAQHETLYVFSGQGTSAAALSAFSTAGTLIQTASEPKSFVEAFLEVDSSGNVWIGDYANKVVDVYPQGNLKAKPLVLKQKYGPNALTFDALGTAYVADVGSTIAQCEVVTYEKGTSYPGTIYSIAAKGLAPGKGESIFATLVEAGGVEEFNGNDGQPLKQIFQDDSVFLSATDTSGNLYSFLDVNNQNKIEKATPSGHVYWAITNPEVGALAVHGSFLYAGDAAVIYVYDASNGHLQQTLKDVNYVSRIVFGEDGRAYALSVGNTPNASFVSIFSGLASTKPVVTLSKGLGTVSDIAVYP